MKKVLPPEVEARRCGGVKGYGPYGAFELVDPETGRTLRCIVSDGRDWHDSDVNLPGEVWEHASVSTATGLLPRWGEMQYVKTVFWEPEETVIQIHPPQSEYVNKNEVLHLWKPVTTPIPRPPRECV